MISVALQPGKRVAFLALRDPVGPFIDRQITISDIQDLRGQVMAPWTGPIETTLDEQGGVVSGQVLRADGTPVDFAEVRIFNDFGCIIGISSKNADADGRFNWDFLIKSRALITAIDPLTGENRTVAFNVGRHGQRLNVNIVFLARGTLKGRVLAEDGVTPLENVSIRVIHQVTMYSVLLMAMFRPLLNLHLHNIDF